MRISACASNLSSARQAALESGSTAGAAVVPVGASIVVCPQDVPEQCAAAVTLCPVARRQCHWTVTAASYRVGFPQSGSRTTQGGGRGGGSSPSQHCSLPM